MATTNLEQFQLREEAIKSILYEINLWLILHRRKFLIIWDGRKLNYIPTI